MTLSTAIRVLKFQAGIKPLKPLEQDFEGTSLSNYLWALTQGQIEGDWEKEIEVILNCLQAANLALNGPVPSGHAQAKQRQIPDDLICAITSLCWECLETELELERKGETATKLAWIPKKALWQILCGWMAVLDGDIDDIKEHVQLEQTVKDFRFPPSA